MFTYLGFDLVSELTFGESFNMLTTGKRNEIVLEFEKGKKAVGFMLLTMWMFYLARALPTVQRHIRYWMKWYGAKLSKRREVRTTLQSPTLL